MFGGIDMKSSRYRVKPGKSQSALGMIVGIILIFIGITQVSQFGLFGVVWTLVAVAITGYHAVNVFSNKGVSTYEVDIQENNTMHSSEPENFEEKLRQLHRLKEDRIISEEEYEKKKTELLNAKW